MLGSWTQPGAQPGSYMTWTWDGTLPDESSPPSGDYRFRVGPEGGQLEDGGQASFFSLYDHIFPIRGKHQYGDGIGAPRKGHSHQGQDVFAKCGTPLVAARGGKVQYAGYHGAAGNYIVIDAKGTGRDYAYMHLTDKVTFKEGDRVYTGTADRHRRRERQRVGLPPALRDLGRPRLVRGRRVPSLGDEGAQEVGRLELRRCARA